ncbi:NUDIX domain-containing protein [Pseudorhizobium halotolerans]|uniref:NUDIX domain-containing protein n=1 Tax=Pseudorhizobium halotolerans TaxID=1233081 RepID=A0ABN7JED9_9HYPH|nr:NUDIX domain-containing protein [Pseudorhizobium halotolerans]CAD7026834.1 NUDIX domain-containing protein [Pseudorhizobium halotolerans]
MMTIFSRLLHSVLHLGHWILHRATLAAVVVIFDNDNVLLVRSRYRHGWHLPGGFLDPPETFEAGARREALEELGYELLDVKLVNIDVSRTSLICNNYCGVFLCSAFRKARDRAPNWEIQEARWFNVSTLPDAIDAFAWKCVFQAYDLSKGGSG